MIQTFHHFAINATLSQQLSFLSDIVRFAVIAICKERKCIFICLIVGCPDHGRRRGATLSTMRRYVFRILAAHVEVSVETFLIPLRSVVLRDVLYRPFKKKTLVHLAFCEDEDKKETSFRKPSWHLSESVFPLQRRIRNADTLWCQSLRVSHVC